MDAIRELDEMQKRGVRFTVHRAAGGRIEVQLGDYRTAPLATTVVQTFDEVVIWLREQGKG